MSEISVGIFNVGGQDVRINSSLNVNTLASLHVLFFKVLLGQRCFANYIIPFLIVTVGAGVELIRLIAIIVTLYLRPLRLLENAFYC